MNKKTIVVIIILLALAFLIAFHQYYYYQTWFEAEDIHHETFMVAFVCLALGIIISKELEQ